eukprot:gene7785-9584_t
MISFLNGLKLGSIVGDDLSIYPIGTYSQFIANEILNTLSTSTNSKQQDDYHPISLILIDRNLDLVGPCLHTENAMDRIYSTITNTNDGKINIDPIYNPLLFDESSEGNAMTNLPNIYGSVSPLLLNNDRIWNIFFSKTLKEATVLLKRKLVDIIAKENLNFDLSTNTGAININSLLSLLNLFKDNDSQHGLFYKYQEIIECISAIAQTYQSSSQLHWDHLQSIEKILLLSSGFNDDNEQSDDDDADSTSLLSQITELINTPISGITGTDKYTVMEIFTLSILAYSLISDQQKIQDNEDDEEEEDDESDEEEESTTKKLYLNQLKLTSTKSITVFSIDDELKFIDTLTDRILKDLQSNNNNNLKDKQFINQFIINNQEVDEEGEEKKKELKIKKSIIEKIILFKRLGTCRNGLNEFKSLIHGGITGSTYQGLISQVCKAIFATGKKEIKDLEKFNPSTLVGSLLRGWVGRAGYKKRDKPIDNRKIIIYVLGGITYQELKELTETTEKICRTQSEFSNYQIIFGSSSIQTGVKILSQVFTSSDELQ